MFAEILFKALDKVFDQPNLSNSDEGFDFAHVCPIAGGTESIESLFTPPLIGGSDIPQVPTT